MKEMWQGFRPGKWQTKIDGRDFIQKNYTPYDGDDSFLAGPTQNTKDLWQMVLDLQKKERENGGVLDMDTKVVSTITSHGAGYLNKDLEQIVGLQTDKPFKRALQPFGGIRMAQQACKEYGYDKLAIAGGVASNTALRELLEKECAANNIEFYRPSPVLCTDNAAMIGIVGYYKYLYGEFCGIDAPAFSKVTFK